jgi:hypothetical protein
MDSKIESFINIVLTFALFFFLICSMVACNKSKTIESRAKWTVTKKTILGALTINENAVLNAADGYLLIMTVDGVETPIKAGFYRGKIVLTPTRKISKALYNGMGTKGANTDYRTALFIDDNKVIEESSVTSALVGGTYDGKSASGVTITSNNNLFNGIIINDSGYKISNVTMTAKGAGLSDFLGYGAGIAMTGRSKVEIDNYTFNGAGPIRHAIYVGGDSPDKGLAVTVNNSFIKADGSVGEILKGSAMSSVPWVLGIETYGHVRAQMIDGYGNVTYQNSTILSDGWGVLSMDETGQPAKYGDYSIMLKVEDSVIDITGTSGYGSYSIGACRNIFSNTTMGNSKYSKNKYGLTYALIVANEYAGGDFINRTNVTAKYGVMFHKNQTGVTKVDSSTFNTSGANFLIKHCYPVINVSNSKLNSDAGVIVQLMTSDDPGLMGTYYSEVLDSSSAVKDKNFDIYHVNKIDTKIFNTEVKDAVSDARINFSNMDIKGDFYNSVSDVKDPDLQLCGQNLILNFDKVNVTGVISSTTAIHKNYSFYFSKEKDEDGNKIVVNGVGYQIKGKWEVQKTMSGPGGGPIGNMPAGGMLGMGGPGGGSSMSFTPVLDANGNYVIRGDKKYDLYEGVIVETNATYLGDLINTPAPAVNNGLIVTLKDGTVWTITGTSYLTGLTIDNGNIAAPEGSRVEMTVNGKKTEFKTGQTYSGNIVLSLVKN